ncbi:hypothetical protein ABEB22_12655 [Thioclava sp. 'Guangxiensis']|uniref:hypothetical protein n=1 Tax=Thioclava sp. 'Guangxiensis' TaxID=3149044 RepID=UPI003877ECA9
MSSSIQLISSQSGPVPAAKSHSKVLPSSGGRGRGRAALRRAHCWHFDPVPYRAAFAMRWSVFLREMFQSREDVAAAFGVTFGTACNWWDGLNRPYGDHVALAALAWPEDFARLMAAE